MFQILLVTALSGKACGRDLDETAHFRNLVIESDRPGGLKVVQRTKGPADIVAFHENTLAFADFQHAVSFEDVQTLADMQPRHAEMSFQLSFRRQLAVVDDFTALDGLKDPFQLLFFSLVHDFPLRKMMIMITIKFLCRAIRRICYRTSTREKQSGLEK